MRTKNINQIVPVTLFCLLRIIHHRQERIAIGKLMNEGKYGIIMCISSQKVVASSTRFCRKAVISVHQRGPTLEDYIEKGLHGSKQVKISERKRFLGTIRERIVLALTTEQVYSGKIFPELIDEMKAHPQVKMLLNGKIPYSYISKYTKLADEYHIPFKIVDNKEHATDIGLVLAYDSFAIEKAEIFIKEKETEVEKKPKKKGTSALKGLFKRLLK